MTSPFLQLQDLIGRRVVDANGKPAGRIEEIVARKHGPDYLVEEFHLGTWALMERLSVPGLSMILLHLFGAHRRSASTAADWKQMDLSDPLHPKLKCDRDELKKLE